MTGWFCSNRRWLFSWFFLLLVLQLPVFQGPAFGAEEPEENFSESVFQRYAIAPAETAEDIFGGQWGFIHPFVSLGAEYTDNLFNTDKERQEDLTTVISPGLWLALPSSREQLLDVTTMNTAPGGLEVSRLPIDSQRRYQGYALYRADIKELADHSEFNRVNQRAEGLFSFRLRGGLSLELLDIYRTDDDEFSTSTLADLDRYRSNLFNARLGYDLTEKIWVELDYSNHRLNYRAARNAYRDREDDACSGYLFFSILPKTALFVSADYIDIRYDQDDLVDSTERNYYGGVQWIMTAHSVGRGKLGFGEKDYAGEAVEDRDNTIVEAQFQHWLTPKTSIAFIGARKTNETTLQGPEGSLSHDARLVYRQRFTRKLNGQASLGYARDSFAGDFTYYGQVDERTDEYYRANLKLGFDMKSWLNLGVEYAFEERDSNFDAYNYRSNTVFFNVTFGI